MKPLRYALDRGIMNFPIRKRSKDLLVTQESAVQALPGGFRTDFSLIHNPILAPQVL